MGFPQDDSKRDEDHKDRRPDQRPDEHPGREEGAFPFHPVALKIVGDGILAASVLQAATMEGEQAVTAILLALFIGIAASSMSGTALVRAGHRRLWEITSLACLAAMGVLLSLHGALFFGVLLGVFALWRWRRLTEEWGRR